MPFTPIADCWKVELVGHHATTLVPIVNVLHVLDTLTHTDAQAAAIASVFDAWMASTSGHQSNEYGYDFTRVTDAATSTGPQNTDNAGAYANGSAGTSSFAMSSILTKFNTAFRGRSYRGRVYMLAVDGESNDNAVDSSQRTNIAAGWGALATSLAALPQPVYLAVASRKLGVCHAVVTTTVEQLVATQRRRVGR